MSSVQFNHHKIYIIARDGWKVKIHSIVSTVWLSLLIILVFGGTNFFFHFLAGGLILAVPPVSYAPLGQSYSNSIRQLVIATVLEIVVLMVSYR